MTGVHIVTDSSCDLTEIETTTNSIGVVPLSIRFGDEEFIDREELSADAFYAKMASTGLLPETAAPSPGRFEQAFRGAAAVGASAVVCINLSGELSATVQSARNAATAVAGDIDVRVIDSRSLTGGLGTMVLEAAAAARNGADVDAVVALVESMIPRTEIYGGLDTLENLKKGGRIGSAKALLGSMLSVKPIIHIADGAVEEALCRRARRETFDPPRSGSRHRRVPRHDFRALSPRADSFGHDRRRHWNPWRSRRHRHVLPASVIQRCSDTA
jgi:DegV family protein with EDD domain